MLSCNTSFASININLSDKKLFLCFFLRLPDIVYTLAAEILKKIAQLRRVLLRQDGIIYFGMIPQKFNIKNQLRVGKIFPGKNSARKLDKYAE